MRHRYEAPGPQDHRLLDYFMKVQSRKSAQAEIACLLGCAACAARLTTTTRTAINTQVVVPLSKARLTCRAKGSEPVAYCSACWYGERS